LLPKIATSQNNKGEQLQKIIGEQLGKVIKVET
jgi:hypothetical protein